MKRQQCTDERIWDGWSNGEPPSHDAYRVRTKSTFGGLHLQGTVLYKRGDWYVTWSGQPEYSLKHAWGGAWPPHWQWTELQGGTQ